MDLTSLSNTLSDTHFMLASIFWSAIASGYCIYGWKQHAGIPLAAGFAMTAASFVLSALWMSVACVAVMVAVWWLLKEGY